MKLLICFIGATQGCYSHEKRYLWGTGQKHCQLKRMCKNNVKFHSSTHNNVKFHSSTHTALGVYALWSFTVKILGFFLLLIGTSEGDTVFLSAA